MFHADYWKCLQMDPLKLAWVSMDSRSPKPDCSIPALSSRQHLKFGTFLLVTGATEGGATEGGAVTSVPIQFCGGIGWGQW